MARLDMTSAHRKFENDLVDKKINQGIYGGFYKYDSEWYVWHVIWGGITPNIPYTSWKL